MHKFMLMMLLVVNVYSWNIKAETTNNIQATQQAKSDPDIIVIQVPDKITYQTDNDGLRCTAENLYCPEIKFKKINQRTNQVLDSWYLDYDTKNITNINYKDGRYSCQYSSNDIIEYTQTFTNKYCQKELLIEKKALKNGKELFGFDFKKLDSDIENIKIDGAISSRELAKELDISLDDDKYESKGFFSFSQIINKILTFSEDIKGTDSQMNLIIGNLDDTSSFTQSYSSSTLENNINDLFVKKTVSTMREISNYLGFTDTQAEKVADVLDSVTDVKELFNTQIFGFYLEWVFMNSNSLTILILVIALFMTVMHFYRFGFGSIKKIFSNSKIPGKDRDSILLHTAIFSVSAFIFLMPFDRDIIINDHKETYPSTIAQDVVEMVTDTAVDFADVMINKSAVLVTRYMNKVSNIYTKDELKIFSDTVAVNLIIAQRQRNFFEKQCKGAYNISGDTFMKSENFFSLHKNYSLYNHGVPTFSICKNTESKIYLNLKNIDENAKLLDYKINHQNSDAIKNMNALNTKLLLTTNDFGWILSPLIYFTPRLYEDIATDLEDKQEEKIDNFTKNFYKDKDVKNINDSSLVNKLDLGQDAMAVLTEYSLMHMIPGFSALQKKIEDKMSIKKDNNTIAKDKKGIINFLTNSNVKIFSIFGGIITSIINVNAVISSHILATMIFVKGIKVLKMTLILGMFSWLIFVYFARVILYYNFSQLYFLRFLLNDNDKNLEYIANKSIYMILYPFLLTISMTLLFFFDKFSEWLFQIYKNFQLENMKLTSYVATQNQTSMIDTITTSAETIAKIGAMEGTYQIVMLVVTSATGIFILINFPKFVFSLIGNDIYENDNVTEQIERNSNKTNV